MTTQAILPVNGDIHSELARWISAGAAVLAIHLGLIAGYWLFKPIEPQGEADAHTAMSEIGKKSAQRLVLGLKGRIGVSGLGDSGELFVMPLSVPKGCQPAFDDGRQLENWVDELEDKCQHIFPTLTETTYK